MLAAAALTATLVVGAASGAFTPAWTFVPAALRARLTPAAGGALYLPARTPLFYRYRAGAEVRHGILSARFVDRVRIRQGVWRWTGKSFLWRVRPIPAAIACGTWTQADKTLQLAGNKVYWSADGTAWRCITDRRGRRHVLTASDGGALPDVALARVVASGLDVAGR